MPNWDYRYRPIRHAQILVQTCALHNSSLTASPFRRILPHLPVCRIRTCRQLHDSLTHSVATHFSPRHRTGTLFLPQRVIHFALIVT